MEALASRESGNTLVVMLGCKSSFRVCQLRFIDGDNQRPVVANRTVLKPHWPQPNGLQRDKRNPNSREEVTVAATNHHICSITL